MTGNNDEYLIALRLEADSLGVKYHHRAGVAKIQEAINTFKANWLPEHQSPTVVMDAEPEADVELLPNGRLPHNKRRIPVNPIVPLSQKQWDEQEIRRKRKEAGRLIRVRIQNMNPLKKDWDGEIISVGSSKMGTHKKFIPFGTGEPYHIPYIMYEELKEKKCGQFVNARDEQGRKIRKSKLIREYAIEVLDPLTKEEIKDIAHQQAIAAEARD